RMAACLVPAMGSNGVSSASIATGPTIQGADWRGHDPPHGSGVSDRTEINTSCDLRGDYRFFVGPIGIVGRSGSPARRARAIRLLPAGAVMVAVVLRRKRGT